MRSVPPTGLSCWTGDKDIGFGVRPASRGGDYHQAVAPIDDATWIGETYSPGETCQARTSGEVVCWSLVRLPWSPGHLTSLDGTWDGGTCGLDAAGHAVCTHSIRFHQIEPPTDVLAFLASPNMRLTSSDASTLSRTRAPSGSA